MTLRLGGLLSSRAQSKAASMEETAERGQLKERRNHGQCSDHIVATCASRNRNSPRLALPKNLPDLVDEEGGGGFWIWEAVGARDWRMEYVRCMVGEVRLAFGRFGVVSRNRAVTIRSWLSAILEVVLWWKVEEDRLVVV